MAEKRKLTPNPNHAIAKGQSGTPLNGDMSSDLDNDAVTSNILADLKEAMGEKDRWGRPQDPRVRDKARQDYLALRAGAQNRATEKHDAELRAKETETRAQAQIAEAEAKRAAAEAERARIGLEHGRLRIEEDRIDVERAKVVIQALETIGRNPALMAALPGLADQLSARLLSVAPSVSSKAPTAPQLALTEEAAKVSG